MSLLLPAQISNHCTEVKIESHGIVMPNLTNFIDYWVVLHNQSSNNSSGVQITGQSKPACSMKFCIFCLSAAFARCL